ncbi:ScbR family autoregulator-binding transcription factor [Actinophytocola sp.]|uniref:ScbR family autoregulator-binding transcription factor n=1 Tax=Actinophytocola sp. TaxID=1872138 RepID=UPI002ED5C4B7
MSRQDRAERTRNLILDAAAEVFEARGFAGASLSDILARAGVTKGALYFHFESKEELAKALVEEHWTVDPPAAANPIQSVIDLCHAFCDSLRTNIRVRASSRLVTETDFDRPYPRRWLDMIREFLEAAREAGDLRPELDPVNVTAYVGGAVLGIQTMSGALTSRADLRERMTDMWRISLPGMVPPRRLSRFDPAGSRA